MATTTRPPTGKRAPKPSHLGVHVLGGGKGESIVVELPDGAWGVVDCYARRLGEADANPTLRFLRERDVDRLAFLCLTHPHDDHFRGMSHLLEAMPVAHFWRFGSWSRQQLGHILKALHYAQVDPGVELEGGSADDLEGTISLIGRRVKAGEVTVTGLSDVKLLYQGQLGRGRDLTIQSIAPATAHAEAYQASVLGHVLWHQDPGAGFEREPPAPRHNAVSAALLVRYGETSVVLGGDVESAGWAAAVAQTERLGISLAAHVVKVSHHGSTNGYCPGLWDRFASGGRPVAVVTLYRNQGLPRIEAVRHIAPHAQRLLVTSRQLVTFGAAAEPRFWPDWELGVRLAARATFHHFVADEPDDFGVCSIELDHRGSVHRITTDGAADTLTLDPAGTPSP